MKDDRGFQILWTLKNVHRFKCKHGINESNHFLRLNSISKLDQIRSTCKSDKEYTEKITAMAHQVQTGGVIEESATPQPEEGSVTTPQTQPEEDIGVADEADNKY